MRAHMGRTQRTRRTGRAGRAGEAKSLPVLTALSLAALALGPACRCDVEQLETPIPRMVVDPQRVVLDGVAVAQDTRIVVQVHNPSIVTLSGLTSELVNADAAFRLRAQPDEVLAGQTEEIVIVVRPLTPTTLNATLVLTADAPARPARVEVPIVITAVDAGLPDICDYPEEIDFQGVGQNDVGRADVSLRNCGIRDLLLDEVRFCPTLVAGGEADPEHPECGVDPSIRLITFVEEGQAVGPEVGATLTLAFEPTDLLEHTGELIVFSNDPDENPVVIPVRGTGAACPTACIELVDDPEAIEPFDTVRIDGRCSSPAGEGAGPPIEAYEWTLDQRPVGSTAELTSASADRTELPVDLAGRYCVRLQTFDADDIRSCGPAVQCFDVVPTEELLVQLVWDHPDADLDLHMVRDGGEVFTHEGDVYFSNRQPVGAPWSDVIDENPNLDHDDNRGYGPENVNIVAPAAGSRWRLFVHYWNSQTDGSARTEATVRVFVYGQQVIEVSRTFEDDEQLWQALDITWPQEEGGPAAISQIGVVEDFARPF